MAFLLSRPFGRTRTWPHILVYTSDQEDLPRYERAVQRVHDELAPMLGDRPGVAKIVVKSTIHRPGDGELRWFAATDEREGPPAHILWLAFKPGGRYVGPEGVAAILSDALLALAEREGSITPLLGQLVAAPVLKEKDSTGVAPRPLTAAKKEAGGMLVDFRPGPLGHTAPTPNGA
jgi:hypothetical protein